MTTTPTQTSGNLVTAEPVTRRDADGTETIGVALIHSGRRTVPMDLHAALRIARQLTDAVNAVITARSPHEPFGGEKTRSTSNRTAQGRFSAVYPRRTAPRSTMTEGEFKSADKSPG